MLSDAADDPVGKKVDGSDGGETECVSKLNRQLFRQSDVW